MTNSKLAICRCLWDVSKVQSSRSRREKGSEKVRLQITSGYIKESLLEGRHPARIQPGENILAYFGVTSDQKIKIARPGHFITLNAHEFSD